MNSPHALAYWLMPEELVFPVAILLVVLGLFLRLIGLRSLGGAMLITAIGLVVLPMLLGPLLEGILMQIPMWMVVLFLVALGFYFVRLVLSVFLGKEGAGTLLAMAVAGALKKMTRLPSLLTKWTHGLGALLHRPNPGMRVLGIALAILLAVLGGLAGRGLSDSGLLPWSPTTEVSRGQATPLSFPLTTLQMEKG